MDPEWINTLRDATVIKTEKSFVCFDDKDASSFDFFEVINIIDVFIVACVFI